MMLSTKSSCGSLRLHRMCAVVLKRGAVAVCGCALLMPGVAAAQSFEGLVEFPGASSARANAISADGAVVVGVAVTPGGERAFWWSQAAGMVELPMLAGWASASAMAASADGTMIVGRGGTPNQPRAALWSTRPGMPAVQDLGLPAGQAKARATGVSGDGAVVVGYSTWPVGFRWTQAAGMESLQYMNPLGVSADGEVAVGAAFGEWGGYWASSTGVMQLLNPRPSHHHESYATGASADGSVIVGARTFFGGPSGTLRWDVDVPTGQHTWRWLDEGPCGAQAVSGDGTITVGGCEGTTGAGGAVLWHESAGALNLREYLQFSGVSLGGWELARASGVSADGKTLTGWGGHNGVERAWVATVPARAFCYANCDNSETPPMLNIDDFVCFINEFAHATTLPHAQQVTHYANCDRGAYVAPVLNVDDLSPRRPSSMRLRRGAHRFDSG